MGRVGDRASEGRRQAVSDVPARTRVTRAVPAPETTTGAGAVSTGHPVLDLQRTAGNRATMAVVSPRRLHLPPPAGQGPPTVRRPPTGARWRLPPQADLQALLTSGTVDESVVQSRVRRLLVRMEREGRLRIAASISIDTIMAEMFPSPGTMDQAAYERYIDPADRSMVYESVHQAHTAPESADRPDLQQAMREAAATADTVAGDEAGLRAVFGDTHWSTAAARYRTIKARLQAVAADIDNKVSTDYNLDAQEIFLGGWASFGTQHMHLLSDVVADPLTAESKATLLHEAAHLATASITDHVYYGSPGFVSADADDKVNNAAHYEELPRRAWGASSFDGQTFTPGLSSGGAPLTTEERIRADATNYFRQAWDAAADVDDMAKGARRDQLDTGSIDSVVRDRLLEVSPLMDLTLHEQRQSPLEITRLDVTTTESIARGVQLAGSFVSSVPAAPMGPFASEADEIAEGRSLVIDGAVAAYGALLGDAARDRRLLDWLDAHYGSVFP